MSAFVGFSIPLSPSSLGCWHNLWTIPNIDDTGKNDVQNVTNNSTTSNTNNTLETERSKKSRKVSHYATTPFFANRQQQQQQSRLFFNNHPENDMLYKKVLPRNTSYSGVTQSGKKAYIFDTSMVSNVKAKKTQQ